MGLDTIIFTSFRFAIRSSTTEHKLAFLHDFPEARGPVTSTNRHTGLVRQSTNIQNLVLVSEESLDIC